jgi:hypothetical protein
MSPNYSLILESMWNKTDLVSLSENNIILHRHPLLYGAAIYALLLIIVGTIGSSINETF